MENQALMHQMVANARQALKELEPYTQEQIDELCRVCCLAFKEHAEELAREAVEETGLGNVPDKIMKNTCSPDGVWYAIQGKKSVGVIGHDERHHLTLAAHPKGILSCVIPTTNPNITILFNGVYGLKGRNVMLITPTPGPKNPPSTPARFSKTPWKRQGLPNTSSSASKNPTSN